MTKRPAVTRFDTPFLRFAVTDGARFPVEMILRRQDRTLCAHGEQRIRVRTLLDPSEPAFLTPRRVISSDAKSLVLAFEDPEGMFHARLKIAPGESGIQFECAIQGKKPIWMFEWEMSSVSVDEVIIPALGGQSLSADMPANTVLSYKYPFWWNAQFVVGAVTGGGVWLHAREVEPRLKMLRVGRRADGFALTYGVEACAPIRRRSLTATWYIDGYDGEWTAPVERYRSWMQSAFGVTPLEQNTSVPPWWKDIDAVLELWGMRKGQAEPHHSFAQMGERLAEWSRLHDPARTILYLPGFAEHGIDSRAPDYRPSPYLGGPDGFGDLVAKAHQYGYRVMIHTNVLAMTFTHPLFRRFKRHQVIDVFGRAQSWGLDLDGDWLAEPFFAYINPGARAWGDLMIKRIGKLVRRYRLDGVFLDQTLLAFNTSRGPNFLSGMRAHIQRLCDAFPGVLFGGEGMHEHVLAPLPFAQIHGIDSIAEVHALDGAVRWRTAHPVSTFLFGRYTRFVAHLLTRHPSHPMFARQEEAYARLGVIPALCLYDASQPVDMPETRVMLSRARILSKVETRE